MSSDFQVILDACVLVNAALRDTLLRLAEPPSSLYLPRWTREIIDETKRTLEAKLGLTAKQTQHLFRELEIHFADAWVKGYEAFIPASVQPSHLGRLRSNLYATIHNSSPFRPQ